ncbi:hypothetical protein ACPCKV_04980 [Streptomyces koyangensis]|uniref:hypothetical protein n=1 Tax=Streptomyces koyangensis TaxID=188770 RepID=UPI003C2CA6E2
MATVTETSADDGCGGWIVVVVGLAAEGVAQGADVVTLESESDVGVDAGGDTDAGVTEGLLDDDEFGARRASVACYLSIDGHGYLASLADNSESVQFGMGGELLEGVRDATVPGAKSPSATEYRWLACRLTEALADALRVADSRGQCLPGPQSEAGRERRGRRCLTSRTKTHQRVASPEAATDSVHGDLRFNRHLLRLADLVRSG